MPYKKAGSIPTEIKTPDDPSKRFEHHLALAIVLMLLSLVTRFAIPRCMGIEAAPIVDLGFLGLWFVAKCLWVWACIHLALHFRLSAVWGLLGLLFLIGIAVIVWAGIQKPKWDLAKARRPQPGPRADEKAAAESDSPY